jgi:hypothetical protein
VKFRSEVQEIIDKKYYREISNGCNYYIIPIESPSFGFWTISVNYVIFKSKSKKRETRYWGPLSAFNYDSESMLIYGTFKK